MFVCECKGRWDKVQSTTSPAHRFQLLYRQTDSHDPHHLHHLHPERPSLLLMAFFSVSFHHIPHFLPLPFIKPAASSQQPPRILTVLAFRTRAPWVMQSAHSPPLGTSDTVRYRHSLTPPGWQTRTSNFLIQKPHAHTEDAPAVCSADRDRGG